MMLKNAIVAAICGSTFVSLPAFGQENPIKPDISIDASASLVENANANGAQKSACGNYRFLGGYRFFFNKYCGVEDGLPCNTPTFSLDRGVIGVKNKSDGGFLAHTAWLPARRWSPILLAGDPLFDLRTIRPNTQTGFEYLHDGSYNPTQRIVPRSKHRGVFYNAGTLNVNRVRGFADREEPALVFGYIF
jgi:hypothetical protein